MRYTRIRPMGVPVVNGHGSPDWLHVGSLVVEKSENRTGVELDAVGQTLRVVEAELGNHLCESDLSGGVVVRTKDGRRFLFDFDVTVRELRKGERI